MPTILNEEKNPPTAPTWCDWPQCRPGFPNRATIAAILWVPEDPEGRMVATVGCYCPDHAVYVLAHTDCVVEGYINLQDHPTAKTAAHAMQFARLRWGEITHPTPKERDVYHGPDGLIPNTQRWLHRYIDAYGVRLMGISEEED